MSPDQRFRVNTPKVVHETIDGEVIIIHLDTGCYYSLDGTGAAVWDRLDHGASLGEISEWLGQTYPDSVPQALSAVAQLAAELQSEDLIAASDAAPAARNGKPEPAVTLPPAFVVPVLHKHTDMQDLLLLDPIHEVDETGWPSVKKDPAP